VKTVTIYTKPDCVNCEKTKRLFDSLGQSYTTVDISLDKAALATIKGMGFREAPVVVAGDASWAGFKEDNIRAFVAQETPATEDPWDF
jgi:glutaredoxin-like protein NrdH